MIYGHNKTIHRTGEVNVELDSKGNVVAVWFRCAQLPFTQDIVDDNRAESLRGFHTDKFPRIVAIEFEDREES